MVIATVETWIWNNKFRVTDWLGIYGMERRKKVIAEWRYIQAQYDIVRHQYCDRSMQIPIKDDREMSVLNRRYIEMGKKSWCYKLPNFNRLLQAGKLKIAVAQVKRFWSEALSWTLMSCLLTSMVFLYQDPSIYRLNSLYKRYFIQDFVELKSMNVFFDYLQHSFFPNAFKDTPDSANSTFFVLGAIRVWQNRLKVIDCPIKLPEPIKPKYCLLKEGSVRSLSQFDTGSYEPYWIPVKTEPNQSGVDLKFSDAAVSPWFYTDLSGTLNSRPIPANKLQRGYYPFGGYVLDLRYGRDIINDTLKGLRLTNWIDGNTSSIFAEASFYSTNSQHISYIFLSVESLNRGTISTYFEVNSYKPFYFYHSSDITLLVLQVLHAIICLIMFHDIFKQCREIKWKRRGLYQILLSFWNFLAILNILSTLLAYICYGFFIYYSQATINEYKTDSKKFTSFSTPARYQVYHFVIFAFVVFTSYMRVLKVFRCSSTITVMIDALSFAKMELINVTTAVFILMSAFSCFFYLTQGAQKMDNRSYQSSMLFLYALIAGNEPNQAIQIHEILYGISFFVFMTFNIIFLINMYAAAVESGYKKMRVVQTERNWDPVEILAFIWLVDVILTKLGIRNESLRFLKVSSAHKTSLPLCYMLCK